MIRARRFQKVILLASLGLILLIYICSLADDYASSTYAYAKDDDIQGARINFPKSKKSEYLINTTNCRIPDIDPFNDEVLPFIHTEEYTKCSDLDLLTYIDKRNGVVTLNINDTLIPQYSSYGITCCYSKIKRVNNDDNNIKLSACETFTQQVVITYPYVKVTCRNSFYLKVYENAHATTIPTTKNKAEEYSPANNRSFYSVLMVGIDSISKQNFRRTMPKSYDYLEEHYINLRGYNKIGDNTLPNLMAILTGRHIDHIPCIENEIYNDCDFIWNTFSSLGYTTAYGEDECFLSTFNYLKPGFTQPPTDYYYRPYLLAAEQLSTVKSKCHTLFCAGPETSGERILNSAKDLSITLKSSPYFAFFWSNSYSHDNINCPSAMDDKILQFLRDADFISSLTNTIFIFFSDHGYRFGDIRYTNTGSLEERLPFIYFFIPSRFKEEYPRQYENFITNSHRLTTPYDIHNTLQHLLEISNPQYTSGISPGCLNCQSLFLEIYETRSCEDASIDQHWCTCRSLDYTDPTDPMVTSIGIFVVNSINALISTYSEGTLCTNYSLEKVNSAGVSDISISNDNSSSIAYYLVIVKTRPEAMFEATVGVKIENEKTRFELAGDVSRINRYATTSDCVANAVLRKYCHCVDFMSVVRWKICHAFDTC